MWKTVIKRQVRTQNTLKKFNFCKLNIKINQVMDHDGVTEHSLRRQRTLDIIDDDGGNKRRPSQRAHAVASVKKITKTLSKKSSQGQTLTNNAAGSMQRRGSVALTKTSQLSKKKSSTARNGPSPQVSGSGSLLKAKSKSGSMSAKEVLIAQLSKKVSSPAQRNGVELWYQSGSFVATKAPSTDGQRFYICRILQNIYNFTKSAKVRWLDITSPKALTFKMKYLDRINPACILLGVKMDQTSRLFYELPSEQRDEIINVIEIVEDFEKGKVTLSDVDDDVCQVVQVDEPPKKKPKVVKVSSTKKRGKLVKTASQRLREKVQKSAKRKEKAERKPRKKKVESEKKELKRKKATKQDDLKLTPRPDIKVLAKDPLFETSTSMPYVSKLANSRLIFRAIYMEDIKMLKKLLKDKNKIYHLYNKSVDHQITPLEAALRIKNVTIFELLLHALFGEKFSERLEDNHEDKVSIHKLDTGHYDSKSLGVSHIRKIQASRGSREGNNAFLAYESKPSNSLGSVYYDYLAPYGILDDFEKALQKFCKDVKGVDECFSNGNPQNFISLLLSGNYKAAGKLLSGPRVNYHLKKASNQLIKEILSHETEELSGCPPSAVKFTYKGTENITPFHYAAVNPNPKYLERLQSVEPLAHVSDSKGRRPIHFAACCNSPANLELLLKWGANISETCQRHQIPLHYAILARKPKNVKLLLQKASENVNAFPSKFGVGGVNHPFPSGKSPLQIAVDMEETEIINLLLGHGAHVDAKSSISSMQVSPLMTAAGTGNLDIVKLLVKHGAVVEQKDRLGRTALTHACKNGATKVLSYLVHIGANPERPDSSDNYPIHYAAAYGWLFTLRFLVDVGVDINVCNMWKFSPIAVAYVKGHVGIVRELLMNDKVDINQRMEDGTSLLFQACESDPSQDDLFEQIEFLVKEKGAKCDIKDNSGQTALFYLANASIQDEEKASLAEKQSEKIAKLLIENGCDLAAVNDDGFTAAMEALGNTENLAVADFLLKAGCKVICPPDLGPDVEPKESLLHRLSSGLFGNEIKTMKAVQLLTKHKYEKELQKMAHHINSAGFTPLLLACRSNSYAEMHEKRPDEFLHKVQEHFWEAKLNFFKFLITKCHSDVNARVQENKFIPVEDRDFISSSDRRYKNYFEGGKTALAMLLNFDPAFEFIETDNATLASLVISLLIQNGANIDYNDVQGFTPLGIAVAGSFADTVAYLVKYTKCDVNRPITITTRKNEKIEELCHNYLVSHGPSTDSVCDVLITLIDCGINVNARCQSDKAPQGGTFLHILLQNKNISSSGLVKIVDKLLSMTLFDFDAQDDKGRTVLHYAFRRNKGQLNDELELESKLMSRCSLKIKDFKGRIPLHYIFLKKKQRCYSWNQPTEEEPSQLLRLACQRANKSLINEQDYEGKSLLHIAAEKGYFVCIYLLTENKDMANIELNDNEGNSPLCLAINNKHESCAMALIQSGASLQKDVFTVSDVDKARRKKERKEKISKKKSQAKEDQDEFSDDEEQEFWTLQAFRFIKETEAVSKALYKVALKFEMTGPVLQILYAPSEKSGLTHKDKILMAMETGKFSIALGTLHSSHSDPKTATIITKSYEKGRNLLHLLPLSFEANPDGGYDSVIKIAKLLMSAGISSDSVDQFGCTPIQYAILNRHFQLADCLAENGSGFDVKKKDKFGRGYLAALFWRIHSSGIDSTAWDFLEKLIDLKINLDVLFDLPLNPDAMSRSKNQISSDPDYWSSYPNSKTTALIAAILCLPFDGNICHNLLAYGANPNALDGKCISPLMNAVIRNHPDYVRQLLNYDYDPNAVPEEKQEKKAKKKANTSIFRLKASAESDESSEESDEEDDNNDANKEDKEEPWDKAYKAVKKTSSVKLDQKDNDGRTALHYVASPSQLGTFDNGELIYILVKAGAKVTEDKFGDTPLTLAAETCATNIIETFRQLGIGKNIKLNLQYNDSFPVDDGVNLAGKKDCLKDAEKVLRRHGSEMEVDDVYIHEVDDQCNVKDGELLKDKDMDVWYDVLMTKIDVKRYEWGLYNFYKLQLVYQPDKKLYVLFTRWGRIGEPGQFQHTPFQDEAKAAKEFAKIFRQKSGNKWVDFKNYKRDPKKYRLVEDVARKAPPKQREIKLDLATIVASALPQHLHSLIGKLMSPKVMELSMENSKCVNTASLPFGQLNKERLLQGKQLLERIQKLIEEADDYHNDYVNDRDNKDIIEKMAKNCEMIAELSNDYFHVIPQQDFSCERCEPLTGKTIIEHIYFINNMLNYEIVSKMLLAAMVNKAKIHPTDFVYSCLGCKIELMEQDDPMSQLILKYIRSTSDCDVSGIYKLSREGEEERLKATKLGNHRLLWHGTHSTNILSILTRGLLVAPPSAQRTAWAYGKGIYFADEFSMSSSYVHNTAGKSSFMLLSQVALGTCVPFDEISEEDSTHKKRENKVANSIVANLNKYYVSRYSPFQWMVLNSGVQIPYNEYMKQARLEQYIVKDPAQVCLRYLIEYRK